MNASKEYRRKRTSSLRVSVAGKRYARGKKSLETLSILHQSGTRNNKDFFRTGSYLLQRFQLPHEKLLDKFFRSEPFIFACREDQDD